MANRFVGFIRATTAQLGESTREFIRGRPPEPRPPSATIENRTAWRIIISPRAGARPAHSSPAAPLAVAALRRQFHGRPVVVAPRPGRPRPSEHLTAAPAASLILAPFARRLLACSDLEEFDYQSWEKRGFVRTCPVLVARKPTGLARSVHGVAWVVFLVTLIALLLASPLATRVATAVDALFTTASSLLASLPQPLALWGPGWLYWLLLALSALVIWHIDGAAIRRWASEVASLLAVVLVSLALSLGFFLLFTRDPSSSAPVLANRVIVQAGIAVVFFVVLASSIPALMYYLFERQRSATRRTIFLRDAIRLNPNIFTLDEAEFRYGTLADEVYSRKSSQDFLGGLQVSLLINLALTTLGWSLALMPNVGHLSPTVTPYEAVPVLITPFRDPIVFGALGSYFFALNMLFRRYVRADLNAKAYTHVVMRQLVTITLVWAVSVPTQLWTSLGASGQEMLLILSFFVGVVPETALTFLQDYLRRLQGSISWLPTFSEKQPLDDLDGVTLYDRARLLEEGIENVENLAHHNFIDLMLRSHLPTPRLADLVDQAILYLHLYEPGAAPGQPAADQPAADAQTPAGAGAAGSQPAAPAPMNSARAILRRYGLRTATDIEHAYDLACERSATEVNRLLSVLDGEGRTPGRLQTVLDALQDDDWLPYLREWHENRRNDLALTLAQAEARISGGPRARAAMPVMPPEAVHVQPNGSAPHVAPLPAPAAAAPAGAEVAPTTPAVTA